MNRIKALREEKGLTQLELGKLLSVQDSAVSKYETEKIPLTDETLKLLSKIFNVSVDYIICLSSSRTGNYYSILTIPLLGTIRAGLPLLAEENCQYEVEVPSDLKADFALKVTGDSMSWVGICEGDIAVMRQSNTASHGMIVAAGVEDGDWQATLKFYIEERGKRLLRAANPFYPDIILNGQHRIIGHVVQVLKEPPSLTDYRQFLMPRNVIDKNWQNVITTAANHGLSSEQVEHMIDIFSAMVKLTTK